MVWHRESQEISAKKPPKKSFSFMSLGSKTRGWDKNPPPKDCQYGIFGKRMQRSIMGFGSLSTALYSGELITEAALNASHGTPNPAKSDMRYFHQRLESHKSNTTTEYKTMCRAVTAVFRKFPDIKSDAARASQNSDPLISKIRKIMKGAHAARNADANAIRRDILTLSHNDAKRRGWSMPAMIEKSNRGIKSEFTARFLLPFTERTKYLEDPAAYRELVERNKIKMTLSGVWPAILYDESIADAEDELAGLFKSETLLRCGITILCSPSAGREWEHPKPGARSFSASQKESNAEINEIKRITPEAIAYFSTLAVFAVHDSTQFSRELNGIDLSELYHDVISALRMKTEWAVATLEFWDRIFFGEGEHEEEEPRTSREDRFKQLETKQREKEGLVELGSRPSGSRAPPTATLRGERFTQDPDDVENEDQPTTGKSQGSSQSRQQIPQTETPSPKTRGTKRKLSIPDSDNDLSQPGTPQPPAKKKRQTPTSPTQYVPWSRIRGSLEKSIEYAKAAGLKEAAAEFTRIASMNEINGTKFYNSNLSRLEWLQDDVKKKYKNIQITEPTRQEDQVTTSTASTQKKRGLKFTIPGLKNRAERMRSTLTILEQIGTNDLFVAMPPPITRSRAAVLPSQQNTQDEDENSSDQD